MSSLEAGAEMMTFLAPASMCAFALVASVKKPVDSTTTSTSRSAHFRLAGSRSAKAAIVWSPTLIEVSSVRHVGVEAAQDRVVLEQVREHRVVGQVVDADDLDVGARGADGAEEVAADAAESVDTYADSHGDISLGGAFGDPVDSVAFSDRARPYRVPCRRSERGCSRYGQVTLERSKGRQASSASISGVSDDSVSGIPSSSARLSAIASSRRIRPAIASLVSTGSCSWPSSSREAFLCSSRR